jgi:hypothetical protein
MGNSYLFLQLEARIDFLIEEKRVAAAESKFSSSKLRSFFFSL